MKLASAEGESVWKVRQSTVKIENLYSALYRGLEHFSLARPFRIAWEGRLALFSGIYLWI